MSVGGGPRSRQLHHLRLRHWQVGRLIAVLTDKVQPAGITAHLVNERGTSSTCPACRRRIGKPGVAP
jgi:transposase